MTLQKVIELLLFVHCIFAVAVCDPITQVDTNVKLHEKSLELQRFMNESVDPCEDFYKFTCGKWATLYPADKNENMKTSYFDTLNVAFNRKATQVLSNNEDPTATQAVKKVKNFYKSCMNATLNATPTRFKELLEDFGKMPALTETDWDAENFDWLETMAQAEHKYAFGIIIGIGVFPDIKNTTVNQLYIGQGDLEMEKQSLYLEEDNARYRELYTFGIAGQLHRNLGLPRNIALKTAQEIVRFEVELAKGMKNDKSDLSMDKLIVDTTVEEMQEKYAPTIDMKKYLSIVLGEIPTGKIYEYVPTYLTNLKPVIEKTDKKIVANYIAYKILNKFSFRSGDTIEEHERICLKKAKKQFAMIIDNMIYRRYINKDTADDILQMWQTLKALFKSKLENKIDSDWLSEETRQAAIEKLDALQLKISSYEDRDFDAELKELVTSDNDYIGNLKNITMRDAKRGFAKLHEPVKPIESGEELSYTPANIVIENAIRIPVAMLQPYLLYAPNYPDSIKFGMTGFLLAHELIHTFDDKGRQFDKTGSLKDWWDAESTNQFLERRKCYSNQYHTYIFGETLLPKTDAQSENIADNGGLKLAYDAYMHAYREGLGGSRKTVDALPDLKYTGKQLFFIGFAQIWCSDVREFLKKMEAVEDHTPERYRVIGAVSNSKGFTDAFSCAVGSKMNPEQKCSIW